MYTLASDNIASLYKQALVLVRDEGVMTLPRGFKCREFRNISLVLTEPQKNILTNPVRKINRGFMAAEFVWIASGWNDVAWIKQFNSRIAEFSDDGVTFFGAYGPKFAEQLDYVMDNLERDPWTRQAVMTFWRESPPKTKDVPCTVMLHFMRRPLDVLHLTVYMRSNDIWLGLPYDVHNFTSIQILVAQRLGLVVGTYTHADGSLHMYEHDLDKIGACIDSLKSIEFEETRLDVPVIDQKMKIVNQYLREKIK